MYFTTRDVKNKTGVDMSVTGHDSASSARQVKDYHVVVITNLPHFKLPEHSEEDVVQFMVSRESLRTLVWVLSSDDPHFQSLGFLRPSVQSLICIMCSFSRRHCFWVMRFSSYKLTVTWGFLNNLTVVVSAYTWLNILVLLCWNRYQEIMLPLRSCKKD